MEALINDLQSRLGISSPLNSLVRKKAIFISYSWGQGYSLASHAVSQRFNIWIDTDDEKFDRLFKKSAQAIGEVDAVI
ncbi:hypothetical protein HK100_012398, partial [Physocladia obscura]